VSKANHNLILLLDKPGKTLANFNIVDIFWKATGF